MPYWGKMFRKLFSLFLILFLCVSCGKKEEEEIIQEIEYIDPVKDVFIFGEVDEYLQDRIRKANADNDYKNYQFEMLEKGVYTDALNDIDGNTVDLSSYDRFILEVVSVECSHCKRQLAVIPELIEDIDIPFIQYFDVGTKEEIEDLYEEQGISIPEKLIVISSDDGMKAYIRDVLGIKQYPTMIAFEKGKVMFDAIGEANESSFESLMKIAYEDPLDMEYLRQIMKTNRSVDDLKSDLGDENLKKLEDLDHDDYTLDLTFQLMGKKLDFSKISNRKSEVYMNQIDDFSVYEDKKLVLIYTYLRDNSETDKVKFINDLISGDDENEYIVILIEGLESSSAALKNMPIGFNCPVVSVLGYMPDDFYHFGLIAYPTAVFVDKGTFVGAYSDIENKEKLAEAIHLFLSDESIAYKRNN